VARGRRAALRDVRQDDKRTPILIEEFPIASLRINQLMPQLKAAWQASSALSHKLFQVEFLTTLAGDAMITLCYHRPLDEHWHAAATKLAADLGVSIIGRSKGKREVLGLDYVVEKLEVGGRTFSYRQPEGAFTQPNGTVNQKMLNWAYERWAIALTICWSCIAATATSPCRSPPACAKCWPPKSARPRSTPH
jgi:tRNA (uracil-5-)-methyltransferase